VSDEKIYNKILKSIVEHQLPPGARLPEDKLAEAFGKSRTSIRKVLQRLNRPSKQEAQEVLQSRIMLEPLLIPELLNHWTPKNSLYFRQLVTQEKTADLGEDQATLIQLTAQFHYELSRLSGNSVMAQFIEQLCYRSSLIIAAYGNRHSVSCDCGDHLEIIELLDKNDCEKAQLWMARHLTHIQSSLNLNIKTNAKIDYQQLFSGT
jgi:DNA-binding GntR family transcriptional regulator